MFVFFHFQQKFKDELYSEENEKMHEILSKTSTFLYDSLATSLQVMLKDYLKESARRGSSFSLWSFSLT
jgi:hypothetical protein